MDVNALGAILKVEQLSVGAPTLKLGGDKNNTLNVGGNLTVINHTFAGTATLDNPNVIAQQSQQIISNKGSGDSKEESIHLTLSPYLGVVKSPNLPGTRVQVEFAVTNEYDRPKVIKGSYIKLNDGILNFKLFFKVNQNGSREPDLGIRFPVIINAKGATRLSVEYENLEQPLIKKGHLKGELIVLTGDETVAIKQFEYEVNDAMVNTFNALQQAANENNAPIVFDAMIKS